jgi:Galactose-3-O-sulfotransferase
MEYASEGRFKMRNGNFDTLIFIHIPKAAGTTLRPVIERQYRKYKIYRAYDSSRRWPGTPAILVGLSEERKREIGLILGHIKFGAHSYLPQKSVYATMLREPVRRVLSEYYYIMEHPEHPFFSKVRNGNMTVEDYLRRRVDPESLNGETLFLCGELQSNGVLRGVNDESLVKAKDNIRKFFPIVGILEKFDQSMLLFKKILQWRTVYYSVENVTRFKPRPKSLPDRVIRLIRDFNQLDIELYDFALRRFDQELRDQGPDFGAEVNRFSVANLEYGKYLSLILNLVADPRRTISDSGISGLARGVLHFGGSEWRGYPPN